MLQVKLLQSKPQKCKIKIAHVADLLLFILAGGCGAHFCNSLIKVSFADWRSISSTSNLFQSFFLWVHFLQFALQLYSQFVQLKLQVLLRFFRPFIRLLLLYYCFYQTLCLLLLMLTLTSLCASLLLKRIKMCQKV